MSSNLENILKKINEYGNFRASFISDDNGIIAFACNNKNLNEDLIISLEKSLRDFTFKKINLIGLSTIDTIKIRCKSDYIIGKNIIIPKSEKQFLVGIITNVPQSGDIELYNEQALEILLKKIKPELRKLE
ncbi:MAG: hypothetical protein ACTSQP_08900 [Promethearchaeota archaeon]